MEIQESRNKINRMAELVKKAQTVAAEVYGNNSIEFMKANKETIGLMLAIDDIKDVNLKILEELKKLNAKKEVEIIKEVVKKPVRPSVKKD
jgi:hypothetical protein